LSFKKLHNASLQVAEFRAKQIEEFLKLTKQQQLARVARANEQAAPALPGYVEAVVEDESEEEEGEADATPADPKPSAPRPKSNFSFDAGEALAWGNLLAACGPENACAFLKRCRETGSRRDLELRLRQMRGAKFRVLVHVPIMTAEAAFASGRGEHTLMASVAHLLPRKPVAVAAAPAIVEDVEPWKKTPWLAFAQQQGWTTEGARLARDPECEVQRKLAIKSAWQVAFPSIRKVFKDFCLHRRLKAADNFLALSEWQERALQDFQACVIDRTQKPFSDQYEQESWAFLDDATQDADKAAAHLVAWHLRATGVSAVILGLLSRVRAQAKAKKAQRPQRKRATWAEREAQHQAAVKQLALPKYLMPKALDTFTKPLEQISSVRLGNLRLAVGQEQLRALNKDVRDFVAFHGGRVAEGPGGVFIPFRANQSQGYCFVKLVSHANAMFLLDHLAEVERRACARSYDTAPLDLDRSRVEPVPHILDRKTGEQRPVLYELAASERKTKAEMEAEKAKAAEARRLGALGKPLTEREKIVAAMNAKLATPSTEVKVLKPVVLGATRKAAAEKIAAEQAAERKAKIEADFPAVLSSCKAVAPTFETSFSAMTAKAKPTIVKVVDATHISENGVVKAFVASPLTEIGKAQEALRELDIQEEKDEARKAQKIRRAARAKRNAKAKATAEAEGKVLEVGWGLEADSEDEAEPCVKFCPRSAAMAPRPFKPEVADPVAAAAARLCLSQIAAREALLAAFTPKVEAPKEAIIVLATAEECEGYDCSRYSALACTDGTPISHGPIFRLSAQEMNYQDALAEADRFLALMGAN